MNTTIPKRWHLAARDIRYDDIRPDVRWANTLVGMRDLLHQEPVPKGVVNDLLRNAPTKVGESITMEFSNSRLVLTRMLED